MKLLALSPEKVPSFNFIANRRKGERATGKVEDVIYARAHCAAMAEVHLIQAYFSQSDIGSEARCPDFIRPEDWFVEVRLGDARFCVYSTTFKHRDYFRVARLPPPGGVEARGDEEWSVASDGYFKTLAEAEDFILRSVH